MKRNKARVTKKWDNKDEEARYVRVSERRSQELVAEEAAYLMLAVVA